jgi:hypothetical protein
MALTRAEAQTLAQHGRDAIDREMGAQIVALLDERDELFAAFTSLSGLVMEQDPDKWEVWSADPAAAELQRERRQNEEAGK